VTVPELRRYEEIIMRKWTDGLGIAAIAAGLAFATAGCGGGAGAGGEAPVPSAPPAPRTAVASSVMLAGSPLGRILTDRAGRVLYAFVDDKGGAADCTGACVATWPALAGVTPAVGGPGIDRALLGSVPRAEGTTQTTYGGWPLYYYAGDALPGDVTGQGLDGRWFTVGRDGTLVRTTA
jgi:predicted lipoprotein with Yx(FWY)xxD motif